jgi:hypothetical protein
MVGRDPFATDIGKSSLKNNLRDAVAKVKFTEDKRVSSWRCPSNTQARYVRIQLETYNTLSLAEVEVFGHWGVSRGVGRVAYAAAGRDVTVAVVRASSDPRDIETAYMRAAYADALNADVLRQLETYALEYDKYGRGEVLSKECRICKGTTKCETCTLHSACSSELTKMPPAIGGRRRRLKSMSEYLLNSEKPPLIVPDVPKSQRPTQWDIRRERWKRLFDIKKWFKPLSHDKEITPAEALDINPDDVFERLKLTEAKTAAILKKPQGDEAISRSEKVETAKGDAPNEQPLGMDSSSVVTEVVKLRGKQSSVDGKMVSAGDVLPTGHVVKSAIPRSIAVKADETHQYKQITDDKENAKRDRERKAKAKLDAMQV